jgi:hypothetical protein
MPLAGMRCGGRGARRRWSRSLSSPRSGRSKGPPCRAHDRAAGGPRGGVGDEKRPDGGVGMARAALRRLAIQRRSVVYWLTVAIWLRFYWARCGALPGRFHRSGSDMARDCHGGVRERVRDPRLARDSHVTRTAQGT